jgi:hypothetical protein
MILHPGETIVLFEVEVIVEILGELSIRRKLPCIAP